MIESEGVVLCDEGIGGSLFLKNYRRPGRRCKYRVEGFAGFLAITNKRIISYSFWRCQINIPVDDPKRKMLYVQLLNPERLQLSFESSNFMPKHQGVVRLRYNTSQAQQFHHQLRKLGVSEGEPGEE